MLAVLDQLAHSVLAVVFILGSCVFVHELGHFVAARIFGMRVEEFMLGFPPRLVSVQRGETRYGLGLIAFGGFCKIAGMEPGQQHVDGGFYSRPRWAQVIVLVAGAAMNVVLAAAIFVYVGINYGIPVSQVDPPTIASVHRGNVPARQAGLLPGDSIIAVDGHTNSLKLATIEDGGKADKLGLQVGDVIMRVGETDIGVPAELVEYVRDAEPEAEVEVTYARHPNEAEAVALKITGTIDDFGLPATPASTDDVAEAWSCTFADLDAPALTPYIWKHIDDAIMLTISRDGQQMPLPITPAAKAVQVRKLDEAGEEYTDRITIGRIGINWAWVRDHDPKRALVVGVTGSYSIMKQMGQWLIDIVRGKQKFDGVGPVGIIALTAEQSSYGWEPVLELCALISLNLAIINLLPIPIVDGGRVILIGYEALVNRRISEQREIQWLIAGVVFIAVVFVTITFRDVFNLVKHGTP